MADTLYEKIGGQQGIEGLVTEFYQRVLNDAMLVPFFEDVDIEKLKKMQIAFFTIATDGPRPESEIKLVNAHRGRGIKIQHLTRFTDILLETLKSVGVDESDASEICARVSTYSNEIIGDTGVDG